MKKVLALLVVALFTAGVAFAADEPAPAPEKKYGINVGDFIKPVEVKSVDGKETVKLDQIKKKTLFVLISSVCTSCRTEMEDLKNNAAKIKEKADVYAVVIDMDPKSAVARMGDLGFTALADPEYKVGAAGGLSAAPSTLVIENGKILFSKSGYKPDGWKEFFR